MTAACAQQALFLLFFSLLKNEKHNLEHKSYEEQMRGLEWFGLEKTQGRPYCSLQQPERKWGSVSSARQLVIGQRKITSS